MKLAGLRVIDLSTFLPGPYMTVALADHGAEVIKVEMPGEGDAFRQVGLREEGESVLFRTFNRGKKSITLDLKSKQGLADLLALCATADVLVEAFRPGVAGRLGFGYDQVRAVNPRIVYCTISAFGHDSVYRQRPAHDLATEAMSGMLSMTQGQDGKPAIPGAPISDLIGGLHGLSGVLMALLRRERSGEGDYLDISMLDSTVDASRNLVSGVLAENRQPIPLEERTTGGAAFYRLYETRDGGHIALAGQEPKFVRALLGYLGRLDFEPLCVQGPGRHQQPVMEFLEATFLQKTRDEWDAILSTLDVCFGSVKTFPEAFADDNLKQRGMMLEAVMPSGRVQRTIGTPIHFRHEPGQPGTRAPQLGEHNDEILNALRPSAGT